jgi:hypothetical protein
MRIVTILGPLALMAGFLLGGPTAGDEGSKELAVVDVMQQAHKDGLLKKVTAGEASEAEKKQLLKLYVALWDTEPPMGELPSWKEKTGELVVGAAKVVLGEDGAESNLKVNCAACHKSHRPS